MFKSKEKNFISVVVSVHNNENIITEQLLKMYETFSNIFETFEIICVDDCSTDQTMSIIKNQVKTFENCSFTILNLSYYSGVEQSMQAGVDLAIGDFVFEIDDIGCGDFNIFKDLYYKVLEGNDIVSATCKVTTLSSKLYYHIFNRYSNSKAKITAEIGRVVSRRALNRVNNMNKTVPYRKIAYANAGLKYLNIPYEFKQYKTKRMSTNMRKELAINTLVMFTDIAYKFSMTMIILMLITAIGTLFYTLTLYLTSHPVEGWTTTMLFLVFGFSGVFILFAVVIKYLSIILDLVFTKNRMIIDSIEKITK